MARRPYLKMEWIEHVLKNPVRTEVRPNGRIRYWGYVAEMDKYLRVVTEPDGRPYITLFSIVASGHE